MINKSEKNKLQKGASLVEYALLVALIAIAALVAMQVLGQRVSTRLSNVAASVG